MVEAPILDADVFNLLARAADFGDRSAPNVLPCKLHLLHVRSRDVLLSVLGFGILFTSAMRDARDGSKVASPISIRFLSKYYSCHIVR